jgi:hypothetical protein
LIKNSKIVNIIAKIEILDILNNKLINIYHNTVLTAFKENKTQNSLIINPNLTIKPVIKIDIIFEYLEF